MKKAQTVARVKRERESHILINKQAKKLALLSIQKADYKYENT